MDIVISTREKSKVGNGQTFTIDSFHYRPILEVIRAVFTDPLVKQFHLMPFRKVNRGVFPLTDNDIPTLQQIWWSPLTREEQAVHDELYMTEAWNTAQDEIQKQRRTDRCNLERVIVGIILWSDSMQLVQFSHASAWPIYLFFRNLSKYTCQAADMQVCHPITFIPQVSAVLDPSNTRVAQRDISF